MTHEPDPLGPESPAGPASNAAFESNASRPTVDTIGLGFLAEFLEIALRRHPGNVEALAELGTVYTRLKRFRDGLDIDQLLVRLVPANPTAHYNLACSLALCGDPEAGGAALAAAVRCGYDDGAHLAADEDLRSLRQDPRFTELVTKLSSPD